MLIVKDQIRRRSSNEIGRWIPSGPNRELIPSSQGAVNTLVGRHVRGHAEPRRWPVDDFNAWESTSTDAVQSTSQLTVERARSLDAHLSDGRTSQQTLVESQPHIKTPLPSVWLQLTANEADIQCRFEHRSGTRRNCDN